MASYLPWVDNGTAKAKCETSPKSTVKTPGQHKWRHCGVSTVSQKYITQLASVSPLPTLSRQMPE